MVFTTVAVIAFLVWEQPRNLISVIGFVFFLFILLISSAHPDKVITNKLNLRSSQHTLWHKYVKLVSLKCSKILLMPEYLVGYLLFLIFKQNAYTVIWRYITNFYLGQLAPSLWWFGTVILLGSVDFEMGCRPSNIWIPREQVPNFPRNIEYKV